MANTFAYQSVWRDHSLPPHKGWLLTVTNNQAIVLIALISILLAFTQTRSWVIIRNLLILITRPSVQLPGEDHAAKGLSQGAALRILCSKSERRKRAEQMKGISVLFGIVALVNIMVYTAAGVILPWALAGGNETPVVKSKATDSCTGSEPIGLRLVTIAGLADSFYKQCWLDRVDLPDACAGIRPISGVRPVLWGKFDSHCPFSGNICIENTSSASLLHTISPRDIGVDSKSKAILSHRLTCVPINLDPFTYPTGLANQSIVSFMDPKTGTIGSDVSRPYSIALQTLNGPNKLSAEKSGRIVADSAIEKDFGILTTLLPTMEAGTEPEIRQRLHPFLRRGDSSVFIIAVRKAAVRTQSPIEDPFLAAHDYYPAVNSYVADQELTALGCFEQFVLFPGKEPNRELNIAARLDNVDFSVLIRMLLELKDNEAALDFLPVTLKIMKWASVLTWLRIQGGAATLSPMFITNSASQWSLIVQAWFETAFVNARYVFIESLYPDNGLVKKPEDSEQEDDAAFRSLCSRLLLRDSDYTNFYFIWLVTSVTGLIILSLFSFDQFFKILHVTLGPTVTFLAWLADISQTAVKDLYSFCHSHLVRVIGSIASLQVPVQDLVTLIQSQITDAVVLAVGGFESLYLALRPITARQLRFILGRLYARSTETEDFPLN
jgi:hypothetical protein